MSTETVIITVIGLIVLGVAAYFILAYMKGSIKLSLVKTSFSHGDTIKGNFTLIAKKPIDGNGLSVSLVAQEKIETRDSEGKKKTRTREIYKSLTSLEGGKAYPSGFNQSYSFEFQVPNSNQSDFAQSALGQAAKFIGNFMDNERKYIEWHISANLDAKGIDLRDSQKIYVDMAAST